MRSVRSGRGRRCVPESGLIRPGGGHDVRVGAVDAHELIEFDGIPGRVAPSNLPCEFGERDPDGRGSQIRRARDPNRSERRAGLLPGRRERLVHRGNERIVCRLALLRKGDDRTFRLDRLARRVRPDDGVGGGTGIQQRIDGRRPHHSLGVNELLALVEPLGADAVERALVVRHGRLGRLMRSLEVGKIIDNTTGAVAPTRAPLANPDVVLQRVQPAEGCVRSVLDHALQRAEVTYRRAEVG